MIFYNNIHKESTGKIMLFLLHTQGCVPFKGRCFEMKFTVSRNHPKKNAQEGTKANSWEAGALPGNTF